VDGRPLGGVTAGPSKPALFALDRARFLEPVTGPHVAHRAADDLVFERLEGDRDRASSA
jgi:hypothetical protein